MEALSFLASTLRISAPLSAGALGGTMNERAGVVNIGLEGLMLVGAFGFVAGSLTAQQWLGAEAAWAPYLCPLAGLLLAVVAGALMAGLHAVVAVVLRADQIVAGLALNILAYGLCGLLLKRLYGSASNSPRCLSFGTWNIFAADSALAPLNQLFHPLLALIVLAGVAVHFVMFRTNWGLRMRAVGENPTAAESMGVPVNRVRMVSVIAGGALASLGGVWLAALQEQFSQGITGGRGFVALAAMIVGSWRPFGALCACLFFGAAEATQNAIVIAQQTLKSSGRAADGFAETMLLAVPQQALQVLPYVLVIVMTAVFVRRSRPPQALGQPFPEARA